MASSKDVIQYFFALDSQPYEGFGTLVFLNLGIALIGFHTTDIDKSVSLFTKGRWDNHIHDMKPFKI